ncbi:MAG TPA: glycosyltransferase [Anaerolineae bacterium]|nr:glycosyltransferase [Anaerolineae bacterium]
MYVAQVSKHLAELGYTVDIFTRRDDPEVAEVVEWAPDANVVHVPAGPPTYVRKEDMLPMMDAFTLGVLRYARREGIEYDLAHANFWMSGLVALNLKEVAGIPYVVTFHALGRVRREHQKEADEFPDVRFDIEERIVAGADGIIAESPQERHDLVELYDGDPARIYLIPAGFDETEFWPVDKQEARAMTGLPAEGRIILQLGRMVPRKGVANVIRAMARLKQHHADDATLVIVGGETKDPDPELTPEIARLQQIARDEGVADRVLFIGRRGRDVLRYYYSASDIFVTTPWYEPFGITPLEAGACSRPVVGSRVGGIKFTVVDGETGYLVPPRDPGALAARLADLLSHPKRMEAFGRAGYRRVHDHFRWERVGVQTAQTYEDVLDGGQPELVDDTGALSIYERNFSQAAAVLDAAKDALRAEVIELARLIRHTYATGGKLLVAGNGGSAAEAQHLVGELVGHFAVEGRPALPAIALNADTAVITAWSNDYGYEDVFARQVEALGQPGDLLLALSTSGRSQNLVTAFDTAAEMGITRAALLGGDGGTLGELADLAVIVPSLNTQRIQEIHTLIVHVVCEVVEEEFLDGEWVEGVTSRRSWNGRVHAYIPRSMKQTGEIEALLLGGGNGGEKQRTRGEKRP